MAREHTQITLNGEPREVEAGWTVLDLLTALGLKPDAMVVEYNGGIADRIQFSTMSFAEGDVVELVHMVGGG